MDLSRRFSEGLGRKYGFLSLDYIKGDIQFAVQPHVHEGMWERLRLILIHNQLRLGSQLELAKQVVEKEKCPLPVICAGPEEDADVRRNRALAVGAVDYLVVEPFRILSILKRLDDTLRLFWA